MATEFTHSVRAAELELAVPLMPSGGEILELGAGDGWQAAELHRRGFTVTAIDAHAPSGGQHQYFPVAHYDGLILPYPDSCFDAVYSSNVLEHIEEFDQVQSELRRVLRPGGVAVHCVPSSTWRLWTSLGHPIYAARWALKLLSRRTLPESDDPGSTGPHSVRSMSLMALIRLGLWPPRHGEHSSSFGELWLFSQWGWTRRFQQSCWSIVSMRGTKLCYTGNELLGLRLDAKSRKLMSRVFGSSTLLCVVKPEPREEGSPQ